jgi:hypothetical protein
MCTKPSGCLGPPVFQQATTDTPDGFEVSPDGKNLVVAYPNIQEACSYKITEPGGFLAAPICFSTAGFPAGIAIDHTSTCAYAGEISSNGFTEIAAFPLTPAGIGLPTDYANFGPGSDSQGVLVNWNNNRIYASNVNGAEITRGKITPGCVLAYQAIVADGVVGMDHIGQIAQGTLNAMQHPVVTGDSHIAGGVPNMGIFRANPVTGALLPYVGPFPLTTPGAAPLSVVVTP